jgi:glycosyltransferase involved in cell wall biosynthesis
MVSVVSLISHVTATSIPLEIAEATATLPAVEVTVASFYDDTTPESCEVPIVPLCATSRFDIRAFQRLWRLLRRDDIDVLHTHDNFIGSVARILAAAAGVAIVDTEHRNHDSLTLLQNAVNIPTLALADRVVANSNATKESLLLPERLLLRTTKTTTVHNGIDIDRIDAAVGDRTGQDTTEGIQVITVGRLVEVKNQEKLIKAFSELLETTPDARLVLIGDGPLRNELEDYARSFGIQNRVRFLGELSRDEVYRHLAASHIFVMPSVSEGFCVAVLEAMAAGLPVIVSDIEVFHEVVGSHGIFTDPTDAGSFADAISDLAKDPEKRNRLALAGRERARSKFSIEQTARMYYNIYIEVAETEEQ